MTAIYEAHLEQASAWKLRAVSARVREDGDFEAAVILHEAVRGEERALRSLEAPDLVTRLRSAIERCGLLLEARDAAGVLEETWPETLDLAEQVPVQTADVLLRRLRPAVTRFQGEYLGEFDVLPVLRGLRTASSEFVRSVYDKRHRTAMRAFLARFPGDWRAWRTLAVIELLQDDRAAAWRSIERARRLRPDDPVARELELNLAVEVEPDDRLRARLDAAWTELPREGATAGFALATSAGYLHLAGSELGARASHLARAEDAARRGLGLAGTDRQVTRYLRALTLLVEMLRGGIAPTPELFLRVGLPHLARRVSKTTDPLRLVRQQSALVSQDRAAHG